VQVGTRIAYLTAPRAPGPDIPPLRPLLVGLRIAWVSQPPNDGRGAAIVPPAASTLQPMIGVDDSLFM